ncbi:Telomere end binding protein [Penicillium tannophilum]|nr:Telomere end binding protein [Penicillium tannophilum]
MMDVADQPPAPIAPPQLAKIPIAQLSPTFEQSQEKCIEATVTLVWPYSSSTKCLSLLLAEPDFRLRRLHGQVKAIFHGRVAEEVAASHVGIGDNICLALKGSKFVANDTATQTPGRYVAWDVHFDYDLSLEINRSSKDSSKTSIEYHDPAQHEPEQAPPSTPRIVSTDPLALEQRSWESPAFLRSGSNPFGSVPRTSLELSAEEDGFVLGKGRKRPRYSLKRDDWHIVDEPMSPQEGEPVVDWWEKDSWEKMSSGNESIEQEMDDNADAEPRVESEMPDEDLINGGKAYRERSPVFIKPSLDISGGLFGRRPPQSSEIPHGAMESTFQQRLMSASHLPTDTPQLRPVPSPGLPIPSPIVSNPNTSQGYFSDFHTISQTQSADSVPLEADASVTASEAISFSHIPPVSPPRAPPMFVEDIASTHQDDGSVFTPAGLVPHQSPSGLLSENLPIKAALDQTELFNSSEFINDTEMIESGVDNEHVDEPLLSVVTDQVATQPIAFDGSEGAGEGQENHNMEHEREPRFETGSEIKAIEDSGENAQTSSEFSLHALEATSTDAALQRTEEPALEKTISDGSDDSSDESQVRQDHRPRHANFSDQESLQAEDESFSYDEEDEESGSEIEDQYDEARAEASSDEESEAADLPPQPPTQHEVIVLDSDSEDELTSNQPANPQSIHQERRTYRDSSSQSEHEGWDMAEQEEVSQSEAEYEDNGAEAFRQDDRVHDSDQEDESSVDVLARDHYLHKHSTRESSVHDEEGKGDNSDIVSEGASSRDYHSDNVIKPGTNTESVIGLDSDEDKLSETGEDSFPREDSAPASRIEKVWAGAKSKANVPHGLDGTHDERSDEVAPSSAENQIGNEEAETTPVKSIWPQPLTPAPTQEVDGLQATVSKEREEMTQNSPTLDTHESPIGLHVSAPMAPDTGPDATDRPSENTMDSSLLEQAFAPVGISDENLARGPLIVLPTTETAHPEEQPGASQEEMPEAPAVIVSQLPAPDRHAHGLRSKLSYFAPLATLIDHFSALVDTISIVHEVSPIAKAVSGPKDYFLTVQLTDPSMAGTVLQAQLFRRYKSAMPTLVEGNAVLLRNFKVRSFDHSIMLVSVESSSWAVFDGSGPEAQVNGPPVEYSSEERAYASGLRKWYSEFGASMVADHQLQASILRESVDREGSALISESGSIESVTRGDPSSSARGSKRSRKSHRRVTIHELRDGRRYTEVGSPSSKESIHELRDGTLYANL